jgi:hypothetical protein
VSTTARANRVAAIQHHLAAMGADPVIARRYALVACRFEQLRLEMDSGHTTPESSQRYRDLATTLRTLTKELGLKTVAETTGEAIAGLTDENGFLPRDPQRLFGIDWREAADGW